MRGSKGNLWLGWGAFCGVPATLCAFAIAWPLGLLLLLATIAAITIGVQVEKTRDALDEIDRHNVQRRNANRGQ